MKLPDCERCGHSADDHRLDDSLNLDPTDPKTPFRCVFGHRSYSAGPPCECPDYVNSTSENLR